MKTADLIGGLIGMAIGLFAIWEGTKMPEDVVMKIGPSYFPSIMAGLLTLFSATLIVNALRGKSKGTVIPLHLSDRGVQRGLITFGAAIVFCIMLDSIGFIPTSIVFLAFMAWVLGKRNWRILVLAPPLITLAVWLIFEKVLHLALPLGLLLDIL
jgi:putative tricarboxylic transport membrane protein